MSTAWLREQRKLLSKYIIKRNMYDDAYDANISSLCEEMSYVPERFFRYEYFTLDYVPRRLAGEEVRLKVLIVNNALIPYLTAKVLEDYIEFEPKEGIHKYDGTNHDSRQDFATRYQEFRQRLYEQMRYKMHYKVLLGMLKDYFFNVPVPSKKLELDEWVSEMMQQLKDEGYVKVVTNG